MIALLAAPFAFAQDASAWKPLFDGTSLQGWTETQFTGRGEVRLENGALLLGRGKPMTGVTWSGEFPKAGYEIRLEAARIEGNDFFATVTFPVAGSFCTWVMGGWGGDIVGLSSIDGRDASENETRTYFTFEQGKWYSLRLRVNPDRITAWIGDEQVIDAGIAGRSVSLRRGETKLMAPLGIASFATKGAIRKVEYRLLKP